MSGWEFIGLLIGGTALVAIQAHVISKVIEFIVMNKE